MHELVPIGVVGIVFYFTYKMIELPSRRREREMMIERMGRTNGTVPNLLSTDLPKRSFSGLRLGCLLIGVGLGLLVGLIINTALAHGGYSMNNGPRSNSSRWLTERRCSSSEALACCVPTCWSVGYQPTTSNGASDRKPLRPRPATYVKQPPSESYRVGAVGCYR